MKYRLSVWSSKPLPLRAPSTMPHNASTDGNARARTPGRQIFRPLISARKSKHSECMRHLNLNEKSRRPRRVGSGRVRGLTLCIFHWPGERLFPERRGVRRYTLQSTERRDLASPLPYYITLYARGRSAAERIEGRRGERKGLAGQKGRNGRKEQSSESRIGRARSLPIYPYIPIPNTHVRVDNG